MHPKFLFIPIHQYLQMITTPNILAMTTQRVNIAFIKSLLIKFFISYFYFKYTDVRNLIELQEGKFLSVINISRDRKDIFYESL